MIQNGMKMYFYRWFNIHAPFTFHICYSEKSVYILYVVWMFENLEANSKRYDSDFVGITWLFDIFSAISNGFK